MIHFNADWMVVFFLCFRALVCVMKQTLPGGEATIAKGLREGGAVQVPADDFIAPTQGRLWSDACTTICQCLNHPATGDASAADDPF